MINSTYYCDKKVIITVMKQSTYYYCDKIEYLLLL